MGRVKDSIIDQAVDDHRPCEGPQECAWCGEYADKSTQHGILCEECIATCRCPHCGCLDGEDGSPCPDCMESTCCSCGAYDPDEGQNIYDAPDCDDGYYCYSCLEGLEEAAYIRKHGELAYYGISKADFYGV